MFIYLFIILLIAPVLYFLSLQEKELLSGKIKNKDFESPDKDKFNFLWSKGLWKKNEYALGKHGLRKEEIILDQMKGDTVWIRLSGCKKQEDCDLDIFSKNLNILTKDIILVTSDGVKSVPSDIKDETFEKIINHPRVIKWYTQNYDGTIKHEKLKNYPIGFDLHTKRSLFGIVTNFLPNDPVSEKINYMLDARKKFSHKKNKIFCDVHLNQHTTFNNERKRVKDILYKSNDCEFLSIGVDQKSIWTKYSSYKFVISAFGRGLDCHRTWEALFLGAIVIVKKSSLDPLYKDLPVVIVDDWDECLDKNNLKKWENKYSKLTNYSHLNKFFKYDHWIK
jgi:hypothetical protein